MLSTIFWSQISCCHWSSIQSFCNQDNPRSGLWSVHSFVKPLRGTCSHMSLNSVVCFQLQLRSQACPSTYSTWLCIWALIGLRDRLVVQCAMVLTCLSLLPGGKSNCIQSCLYISMQSVAWGQDGWWAFEGVLFLASFHLQCEEVYKSCHEHSSCVSALPPGRQQKQALKQGSTRIWATPGSRSVKFATARIVFLKNLNPC